MRKSKWVLLFVTLLTFGILLSGCTLFTKKNIVVRGNVISRNNKPIYNANVTVYEGEIEVAKAKTNILGNYNLVLPKKDTYKLQVEILIGASEKIQSELIAIANQSEVVENVKMEVDLQDVSIEVELTNTEGFELFAEGNTLYVGGDKLRLDNGKASAWVTEKTADIVFENQLGMKFLLKKDFVINNSVNEKFTLNIGEEVAKRLSYVEKFDGKLEDAKIVETPSTEGIKPDPNKLKVDNGMLVRTEAGNSSFKLKDLELGDSVIVIKAMLTEPVQSGTKGIRVQMRNKNDFWYYGYGINVSSYGFELALWNGLDLSEKYIKAPITTKQPNAKVFVSSGEMIEVVCVVNNKNLSVYRNGVLFASGSSEDDYIPGNNINLVLTDLIAIDQIQVYRF